MGKIMKNGVAYGGANISGGSGEVDSALSPSSENPVQNRIIKAALDSKYDLNDSAETDLVDGDYIPFYDSSATAKKKSLWSNIKAKLKTYFDTYYEDAPTVLTQTLQTPNTQVTFTDAAITTNAIISVYTNVPGLNYDEMDTSSANTIVLTYEAQSSDITVKLVIR